MTPMNDMNITDNLAGPAAAAPAEIRDKVFDPVMTARGVCVTYGDKCAVRIASIDNLHWQVKVELSH